MSAAHTSCTSYTDVVLFKLALSFFLTTNLLSLVLTKFVAQKTLFFSLVLLGLSLGTTLSLYNSDTVTSARFKTPAGSLALSPSLSSTKSVYPQDFTTELQFWNNIAALQPNHKDILINQYILLKKTAPVAAATVFEKLTLLDPNSLYDELE
jgi:hypothetical protein